MVVSSKFIIASTAMAAYMIIWRICISDKVLIGTIAATLITVVMLWLYREDLSKFVRMINSKRKAI